jgi:uncharacterized protein YjbI with pentapeptide repeats
MKICTLLLSLCLIPASRAQTPILDFQYRNGLCLNRENQQGYNAGYFGECGSIEGMIFPNQMLTPGSRFMGANMRRVDLRKLVAENANFERADLTEAVLSGSEIRGCNFVEARLDGASLDFGSNLESCNLERVRANAASFNSANLRRAKMEGGKFRGSSFRDADLYLADLSFADLRDSDLRGADLGNSDLFGSQLSGSFFNTFTRLPFDRTEAARLGMIFTP